MMIQPIVEGHGEVAAVPILLRRLRDLDELYDLDVQPPIRRHRNEFFDKARLELAIELAKKQEYDAILLLFDGDGDDDCPKKDAPTILGWAKAAAARIPCAVVMAFREYEAWFLASIESLRDKRGIRRDAVSHPNPEQPKGAKAELEMRMVENRSYHETADQPALSAQFDMRAAYQKCRSFKHLVKVFGELAGISPWPPSTWLEGDT
ncbi:MAG: DUF4276 family protein [Gemmataceae bacterium]|nr:DUF4276 family protein [Gemmataceae bacterium]